MSDSDDDGPRREWRNEGRATAAVLSTRDEPFRPAAVNSSISSSSSSSSRIDVDRNRDRHWERHTRRPDRDRDREDRPRYVAFLRPATQHHAQLAAACASSFYTLSHIPSDLFGNYATNQPLLTISGRATYFRQRYNKKSTRTATAIYTGQHKMRHFELRTYVTYFIFISSFSSSRLFIL